MLQVVSFGHVDQLDVTRLAANSSSCNTPAVLHHPAKHVDQRHVLDAVDTCVNNSGISDDVVRDFARDTATFSRFLFSRNCSPLVPKSPAMEHFEIITTGSFCPWNSSASRRQA